jgi:fatty-acyl-CoA synthase
VSNGASVGWNYASVLRDVAAVVPDRTAIVCSGRRMTFGEFDVETDRLATGLMTLGVEPGSKVAIDLLNSPEYLAAFYAALKLGAVPVNVNYRYTSAELAYLLDYVDATVVFVHERLLDTLLPALDAVERPVAPVLVDGTGHDRAAGLVSYAGLLATADAGAARRPAYQPLGDDLIFVCTGGTTGMPKAVMWRNEDLYVSQWELSRPGTQPSDPRAAMLAGKRAATTLPGPPLMHGTGLYAAIGTLSGGGTVVLIDGMGLDPARIWAEIATERVAVLTVVGDVFARPLVDALDQLDGSVDLSSLRVISSSGTTFSAELKTALIDRLPGLAIVDSLGATEGMISRSTVSHDTIGAARFTVSDRVGVFTAEGEPIAPGSGVPGYLGVTGSLPVGYYKDPDKTAATFPTIDGRRYSIAGDMATVDTDGTITFLGRGSATINTGGEKVYPEEVEAELRSFADVLDCCVVGLPDDRWGQRVVAVVQLIVDSDVTTDDLRSRLRARLAGYKVPKQVVVVPSLERGPNGKIDYRRVRQLAGHGVPLSDEATTSRAVR